MKTIALTPPKQLRQIPQRPIDIDKCGSCDNPLRSTGECAGCSD
jgi:hypothetical protein